MNIYNEFHYYIISGIVFLLTYNMNSFFPFIFPQSLAHAYILLPILIGYCLCSHGLQPFLLHSNTPTLYSCTSVSASVRAIILKFHVRKCFVRCFQQHFVERRISGSR